jgi:hypothetical protein
MGNNQAAKLPKEELKKLKEMRKRTPEVWVEMINALPSSVRTSAAKLVWWDYFGLRTVADRWPHLDGYLQFIATDVPYGPLVEALIELGYPPTIARTRADSTHRP